MATAVNEYEVEIKPSWSEVEALRQFIGPWVFALVRLPEVRDAVAMVSAELLENAVRFGPPSQPNVGYRIEVGEEYIRVVVKNALDASSENGERVQERIGWIAGFDDAATAYREQIRRVAQGEAKGLGLARIAAEGRSTLTCAVLPGGKTLQVEAVTRFRKRPPSGTRPAV